MSNEAGTFETKAEATGENPSEFCKNWMTAIDLSGKGEEKWRKRGDKVYKLYRSEEKEADEKKRSFNILYPNTETLKTAVYNSMAVPDIRRRYDQDDPNAKAVADTLEKAISYELDTGDAHSVLKAAVGDLTLPGRGVVRVRYEPTVESIPVMDGMGQPVMGPDGQPMMTDKITAQKTKIETVQWDDFRRGPGKTWPQVGWIAFRHWMTRDQLVALNEKVGELVTLDASDNNLDKDKSNAVADTLKRSEVWEIWDKDAGEQIFIAKSYKECELRRGPPDVKYDGFYPTPKPVYAVQTSNSLVPIDIYRYYEDQAEELNKITVRIEKLTEVLKFRGIGSSEINDALDRMKSLGDGEIASVSNSFQLLQAKGGLDTAIWMWPTDQVVKVLQQLYINRDAVKQTIYEITGISDILRGSVNPNEKLGQSEIKAKWGGLRIDDMQNEVARLARDLFRLMAGCIAEYFDPIILKQMTGIELTPEQIQLMRDETLLSYRIDIETDSTIRGDLTRNQQNVAQFVQGFGQFVQSVGPAVQQGIMPVTVAVEMVTSFARIFKLGRQVETALDNMKQQAEQPKQPQPPAPPTPEQMLQHREQDIKSKELDVRELEVHKSHEREMQKMTNDVASADQARKDQLMPEREQIMKSYEEKSQQGFEMMAQALMQNTQVLAQIGQAIAQSQQMMMTALVAPTEAIRDAQGKLIGSRKVLN